MAQTEGSKRKHLKAAFPANRRPIAATSTSRRSRTWKGIRKIAGTSATRRGETGHAHGHMDYLKPCGDHGYRLPFGDT